MIDGDMPDANEASDGEVDEHDEHDEHKKGKDGTKDAGGSANAAMTTQELFLFLEKSPQLPLAMDGISDNMESISFPSRLSEILRERSMSASELGEAALLSRSFTYQLCSGARAPGRDIVLRIALVLGLSLEETQRLLRSAQRGELYPRVRRDAIVIWCIGKRLSLYDTDEYLVSNGEEPLL